MPNISPVFEKKGCRAIVISPWVKNLFEPDAVAFYGNPAQIMRMVQAVLFED